MHWMYLPDSEWFLIFLVLIPPATLPFWFGSRLMRPSMCGQAAWRQPLRQVAGSILLLLGVLLVVTIGRGLVSTSTIKPWLIGLTHALVIAPVAVVDLWFGLQIYAVEWPRSWLARMVWGSSGLFMVGCGLILVLLAMGEVWIGFYPEVFFPVSS